MTLEDIANILEARIKGLQEIKILTIADYGDQNQIASIDKKIFETQTTLVSILESISQV
jgi:hypothetical protein